MGQGLIPVATHNWLVTSVVKKIKQIWDSKGGLQVLRGLLRTKRLRQDSTETEVDIIVLIAPWTLKQRAAEKSIKFVTFFTSSNSSDLAPGKRWRKFYIIGRLLRSFRSIWDHFAKRWGNSPNTAANKRLFVNLTSTYCSSAPCFQNRGLTIGLTEVQKWKYLLLEVFHLIFYGILQVAKQLSTTIRFVLTCHV